MLNRLLYGRRPIKNREESREISQISLRQHLALFQSWYFSEIKSTLLRNKRKRWFLDVYFIEAILKLEHSKPITCNSVCDVGLTAAWEHNPLILLWLLEKLVINCSLGNQNRTKNASTFRLFLLEYGNGSKPICNQAYTHNCQHYLRDQIDILWEEMTGVRENLGTARSGGGFAMTLYMGEMLMKMETWNYKRTSTSYFHNFLFFKATKHSVESLGEEITNEFPATKHRPADD